MEDLIICSKCKRPLYKYQYFKKRDGSIFTKECKQCFTLSVDVFNVFTVVPLLKKLDLPFIEKVWDTTRDNVCERKKEKKYQLTALSVFGKYVAKMNLAAYRPFIWKDTNQLNNWGTKGDEI